MSVRTDSLIQILDTIGAPLIDAVSRAHKDSKTDDLQKDAQAVAALLGKVVELSISMKETLDLKPEETQNDALRIALAAIAGPMVAAQYTQKNGQVPVENDLKRLQSSMQAVLTFADNFSPSEEMATRLGNLAAKGAPVDAHQVNLQYVGAFLPVVEAITAFSFGQSEQKLMMDVADRLVKTSVEMREGLMPSASGDDQKLYELAILRNLAQLYARCHRAESEKLSQNPELAAVTTLDTVWKTFETRAAMLEATVKNISPASVVPPSSNAPAVPIMDSSTPPVTPPPATPPAAAPAADSNGGGPMGFFAAPGSDAGNEAPPPPIAPPVAPPAAPPATEPPPADGNAQGGSPMGFFAAPDAETPPVPPVAPPASPPQPEQPPQQPPPQQPPPPPAEQPPASPSPAAPPAEDSGGSPMSFFTKNDDED